MGASISSMNPPQEAQASPNAVLVAGRPRPEDLEAYPAFNVWRYPVRQISAYPYSSLLLKPVRKLRLTPYDQTAW
jgi:hypothetical protein